jgi:L-ribulose-5-phosphate 3-epimerase
MLAGRLAAASPDAGPQLGLQTWTCRNMTFDQVVEFATRHHIKYLEFIAAHLDPKAPPAENLRKKAILDQHGLVAYSFGVNATSLDKEANRRLFEFARLMGIKLIVVEPKDLAQWDNLEALVKEYDIKLAIHNHGKGSDLNADPANVRRILAARDPRIGVCLDIGWVTAAGFDAAKVFREYGDRVFDLHFKDKKSEEVDGKTQWVDTLPGEGDANFTGLFAEIRRTGWSGVMAVETDSKAFAADPNELMDRSADYFQKQLAGPGPAP